MYEYKFGLNHITTILQELSEEMKPPVLARTGKQYAKTPIIQRLGYILDNVLNKEKLAKALYKTLTNKNTTPILLSTKKPKKGNFDEKWNIIINTDIEKDL
jgi:predicted transcriptional regulator of viral defense system